MSVLFDLQNQSLEQTRSSPFDPRSWSFSGNQSFEANQLRHALAADFEVLAVGRHPDGIKQLPIVLVQQLRRGYVAGGFPDVAFNLQKKEHAAGYVISIIEGPCHVAGDIKIHGANNVNTEKVLKELSEPFIPAGARLVMHAAPHDGLPPMRLEMPNGETAKTEDAVWRRDQAINFLPENLKHYEQALKTILGRQGFNEPTLRVSLVKVPGDDKSKATANLNIELLDEGPRAVLGKVFAKGLERTSHADIVKYLGLETGMLLDSGTLAHLHGKLRQSARFLAQKIETVPPFDDGPTHLKITVTEAPMTPPLSQELPPFQQALVRTAKWLSSQTDWDMEFVAEWETQPDIDDAPAAGDSKTEDSAKPQQDETAPAPNAKAKIHCLVSPKQSGTMLHVSISDLDDRRLWEHSLIASPVSAMLIDAVNKTRFHSKDDLGMMRLIAMLDTKAPDSEGRMSTFYWMLHSSTERKKHEQPMTFQLSVAPLNLIRDASMMPVEPKLVDGFWRIQTDAVSFAIDDKTGRIEHFRSSLNGVRFSFRSDTTLFSKAEEEHRSATRDYQIVYDPRRPITSLATQIFSSAGSFLKVSVDEEFEQKIPQFALARQAVKWGVLDSLDAEYSSKQQRERTRFSIPTKWSNETTPDPMAWLSPMIQGFLPVMARVFPRETPGWVICREAAFLTVRRPGIEPVSSFGLVEMLEESGAGPVHFLIASTLFGYASQGHRIALADAGLGRLTQEGVRDDIKALLHPGSVSLQAVSSVFDMLAKAEAKDLDELATTLPWPKLLTSLALRYLTNVARDRETNVPEKMNRLLDQAYGPVIRPWLESELRKLAAPPQQAQQVEPVNTSLSSQFQQRLFAETTNQTEARQQPAPKPTNIFLKQIAEDDEATREILRSLGITPRMEAEPEQSTFRQVLDIFDQPTPPPLRRRL